MFEEEYSSDALFVGVCLACRAFQVLKLSSPCIGSRELLYSPSSDISCLASPGGLMRRLKTQGVARETL